MKQDRLSNHEFMMLRSLLENGDYREGESPYWRVSRHWDYHAEFRDVAWDACESLKSKGLVLAKPAPCECHRHLTVYALSEKGLGLIQRANGIAAAAPVPESSGKSRLAVRKWARGVDELITFMAIAVFSGLAVHLLNGLFQLGPGLFGAEISPTWFYVIGFAAAGITRYWPSAAPVNFRT